MTAANKIKRLRTPGRVRDGRDPWGARGADAYPAPTGHTALIGRAPTPAPFSDVVKFLFCIQM
ncbi:hypothetical protein GCM10009835_22300 [Planosporangium flavigriseum]